VIEERRDGRDFIGLFGHAALPQDQSGIARIGVCSALSPLRVSWVRREVLPSMAIRSCRSGQKRRNPVFETGPGRCG
jgi:hypothetical protein